MAKKTYNTETKYQFFNNRNTKASAEQMVDLIESEAKNILKQYNNELDLNIWSFVADYYNHLERTWDDFNPHFKRYWLDNITYYLSLNIWNTIWEHARQSNNDKKSEELATKHREMFLKKFQ